MMDGQPSRFGIVRTALGLAAGLALSLSLTATASAATITVSPGDKIQDAVDGAAPGDTVKIKPGV